MSLDCRLHAAKVRAHKFQQVGVSDRHVVVAVNITSKVSLCRGSMHVSVSKQCASAADMFRAVSLCFPFYTQTTSHCHHSIPQIPKGPLLRVSLLRPQPSSWRAHPRGGGGTSQEFFFFYLILVHSFRLPHVQKNTVCTKHTVLIF